MAKDKGNSHKVGSVTQRTSREDAVEYKFLTIAIFDGEVKSLYYNAEFGLYEKRKPTAEELKRYKP